MSTWKWIVAAIGGFVVGGLVRGLLPPFVVDAGFWREFFTGPPMGGLFGLLGAGVAFGAAQISARSARRSAERQDWWDRAKWALDKVTADDGVQRDIGLRALVPLTEAASSTEARMIDEVTEVILGVQLRRHDMDVEAQVGDNEPDEGGDEND